MNKRQYLFDVFIQKNVSRQKLMKYYLIAREFEEKHTKDHHKDSPTCLRENIILLLIIGASKEWNVKSLNVHFVFLQGKRHC